MIVVHLILLILYVSIPLIVILYYRTYYLSNKEDKFFILAGFFLKIFGAISAYTIYKFYYQGGDTLVYYSASKQILGFLINHIECFFDLFFSPDLNNFDNIHFISESIRNGYFGNKTTYTIVKIGVLLNALSLNSFLISSILCSYIAFFSSWKFYKFIGTLSAKYKKQVGYAIFFMPSAVFWGSGLFKDTFTLAGLYFFIVSFIQILGYNKLKTSNIIYLIMGFYLLMNIRSFYLLAVMPFLILWIIGLKYSSIKSASLRLLLIPIVLGMFGVFSFLTISTLSETFQELSIENLVDKSKGFQNWHTTLQGSAYSLGKIEYTFSGLAKKIPAAINVTFFRPYLWESDKPIILLSAIQSFFFTIITLYFIFKMRVVYFISSILKSSTAVSLMGFSLFYAFVVGLTSYNFGALDRYKIPCLSTYIIALLFAYERYKINIK